MKHVLTLLTMLCIVGAANAAQIPNQTVENTKGFAGINYDRQDSEQVGTQRIVNDHSAFNINIQIIKQGALFQRNTGAQEADASLSDEGKADEGK